MENEEEDKINESSTNSPKLNSKPKHAGGRHTKEYYSAPVQEILNLTAPSAARILQQHIEKKKGYAYLKASLQRACEYVIDHAIGKARQKVEHSGGILSREELLKSANALDEKPRDFLADVEELAYKYQKKLARDLEKGQ